ncbi:acyltransferase family protein [Klebsiella michiganensis]|uniref:acyltransferase family protein n=1 Tax=Klebsiella michiganensis TaxID=1134687 RepID=UPI000D6425F3|nr:acyltransferase [Klebsiella michiganensis]
MNSKNYSIQALRAIAALLVVLDHTLTQFNTYNPFDGFSGQILKNVEALGLVGVYIFFIISGYIMSMTTSGKPGGFSSATKFIKKRLARIYPSYWVWLSVLVLLWFGGVALKSHDYSFHKIVSSYLLLPFTDGASNSINPILSQGWTLIYEMFFYLVFAILITLRMNDIKMIIMAFVIFLIFNKVGEHGLLSSNGLNIFFANGFFFLFPLGMLFFKLNKKIHYISSNSAMKVFVHTLSIISVGYLIMRKDDSFYEAAKVTSAILAFTSFYISDIKNKILLMLGDASYSIYLTHTFVVMAYGIISKSGHFSPSILLMMAIPTAFASIIFGVIAYFSIEKKLQETTTKLFFQKKDIKRKLI